jgi:hypothetical protein
MLMVRQYSNKSEEIGCTNLECVTPVLESRVSVGSNDDNGKYADQIRHCIIFKKDFAAYSLIHNVFN